MIRHDTARHTTTIPVVLPVVDASIDDGGHVTVAIDGEQYLPEIPLNRSNLRAQLGALAADRATPLRVQVREADGHTFTDIVTADDGPWPALSVRASSTPPSAGAAGGAPPVPFQVTDPGGVVVGLSGSGFLPGEPVAFALIVLRQPADEDGTAVLHLPAALALRKPGPFVLFGPSSGTLLLADPFSGDQP